MGLTDKHMAYGDDIEEGKRWSLYDKGYECGYKDGIAKSLEAWEKVEKEINESILICRESAQNNIWYDGELAGFLQSKDIIDGNLSEVEHGSHNM